jgi:exportin-5
MCAQLEGAFDRLLDNSAVCGSLTKDLNSMGFHHLTLLIKSTIIPVVKNCPKKLWAKWVVELLYPVFDYFHRTLYESWCDFLDEDLVQVPDTIVSVSVPEDKADDKMVWGLCSRSKKDIGKDLLIQLTCAASDLLAVIASPELNGGLGLTTSPQLDYMCSSSLVG